MVKVIKRGERYIPNIKVLFCPHCGNKITEFYARRLGGDMI